MKTLLIAAGAIALATPAFAQMSGGNPSATPPASSAMPPSSADPAPATTTATPAADPKSVIASEFPTYDKDGNGSLSAAEFETWMVALKTKSGGEPMKPADKASWLKGAFATADADKNKAVSETELATYLTAGA